MAVKNIIARGVGFAPGAVRFIVTHGFGAQAAAPAAGNFKPVYRPRRRGRAAAR